MTLRAGIFWASLFVAAVGACVVGAHFHSGAATGLGIAGGAVALMALAAGGER